MTDAADDDDERAAVILRMARGKRRALKRLAADTGTTVNALVNKAIDATLPPGYYIRRVEISSKGAAIPPRTSTGPDTESE